MAKVLLINPHSPKFMASTERFIPLGILYLSSYLKKYGHEVLFVDIHNKQITLKLNSEIFNLEEYYLNSLEQVVAEFQPDLIGISVHFSGRFRPSIELVRLLKNNTPDCRIVLGGIHPSIFPYEILEEYECIDFVLQGESEKTIVELLDAIIAGSHDFKKIDGLGFRENGKVTINKKEEFIDNMDSIPLPDYSIINIKEYYFDTTQWINPKKLPINLSVPLLSSRSCPRQCSYCSMYLAQGPSYRMRSANNVLDEIEYLYREYNQKYFSFVDDNFTLHKKRALEICNGILKRKLDIQFDTPNGLDISTLDADIVASLVEAGLIRTCLAVESGSPMIRKSINRKITQDKIYHIFDIVNKFPQLVFNTFFVVGFPNETFDTLEETDRLINELNLEKAIISFATPFPGTELFRECLENKLIDIGIERGLHNLDNFYFGRGLPFIKPYRLEKQDLVDFRMKIYRRLKMTNQLKALAIDGEEAAP